MQKIVLCAGLEKNRRALFRRVSRTTMILILRLGFGDEVASLSLAASTLRCRCPALVVPQQPLRRCLKCCGAKCALDMLVADAGAMYEAVDSRFVLVCLNVFLRGRIWDIRGLRFSEQRNFMVSLRNKIFINTTTLTWCLLNKSKLFIVFGWRFQEEASSASAGPLWFSVLKNAFGTQPLASQMPSELSNNCNGNNKLLLVGIADCCLISPFLVQVVFLLACLADHVLSMKDEIHRARLVIG